MSGHGEKLTRKQEQAVAALLSEATVEKAAAEAGVGYATLKRWLAEDRGFQSAYRAARRQLLDTTLLRLQQMGERAALGLHKNMGCGKPNVEVAAARAVLEQLLKIGEAHDLEARLAALEASQQRGKP